MPQLQPAIEDRYSVTVGPTLESLMGLSQALRIITRAQTPGKSVSICLKQDPTTHNTTPKFRTCMEHHLKVATDALGRSKSGPRAADSELWEGCSIGL